MGIFLINGDGSIIYKLYGFLLVVWAEFGYHILFIF